jgi:Uma2 family endonuclease
MATLETPPKLKPTYTPSWEMPPEEPDPDVEAMRKELQALDLPGSDGEPLESERSRIQINLSLQSLDYAWRMREDFYAGGDMFIYFSKQQAQRIMAEIDDPSQPKKTFRGPDMFIVLDVDGSYRRQKWVVWEEDGRYPDVIIEFLSPKTQKFDLGKKKTLYEQTFGTSEYFCFDYLKPDTVDSLLGWRLDANQRYQPLKPDARGWIWSEKLGFWLGKWQGTVLRDTTTWLRFYSPEGNLILTRNEAAQAQAEAAEEIAKAEVAKRQAAENEVARLQAELARLRGDPAFQS